MRMGDLLQQWDVFDLKPNMDVYVMAPMHFMADNRKGDWSVTEVETKPIGEFSYLIGSYVVTSTSLSGGGGSPRDYYPNGHRVTAKKIVKSFEHAPEVSFYQTGSFTAMNVDVEIIGKASPSFEIKYI
jgi:hypothetical protein